MSSNPPNVNLDSQKENTPNNLWQEPGEPVSDCRHLISQVSRSNRLTAAFCLPDVTYMIIVL